MPAERLAIRQVREVLRLKYACGASERVIARSVRIARTAIGKNIRGAAVVGITWPLPEELDDAALECKLFALAGYNPSRSHFRRCNSCAIGVAWRVSFAYAFLPPALYQSSQWMTDVRPVALRNGHDLPRLVDKGVPGIATVIDDVVEGFEDAVR